MLVNVKNIWAYMKNFIYTKEEFYIYQKSRYVAVESPATIKQVGENNVIDVLSFNDESYVKTFRHFISIGDKGYYAYVNGECVHRSWVTRGPQKISFMSTYKINLTEYDVYVHYCATAENARGMNIYPAVLVQIGKDFSDKNIYLLTLKSKDFANRAVEKAGFEKVKFVMIRRLLGFTRISETYLGYGAREGI